MKKFLAFLLTLLVFGFGTGCYIYYFSKDSASNPVLQAFALLGSMVIMMPAFTYWIETFKKILNIEK
jgi:hypothetical protein